MTYCVVTWPRRRATTTNSGRNTTRRAQQQTRRRHDEPDKPTDRPTVTRRQAAGSPLRSRSPPRRSPIAATRCPATAPARASYRPVIYCLMAPSRRSGRPPGEKSKNGSCSNKRVLRAQGRRLPPSDGATDSTDRRRVWSMALNETTREPADPAPTTRLWGSGRLLAHAAAIWRTETK